MSSLEKSDKIAVCIADLFIDQSLRFTQNRHLHHQCSAAYELSEALTGPESSLVVISHQFCSSSSQENTCL